MPEESRRRTLAGGFSPRSAPGKLRTAQNGTVGAAHLNRERAGAAGGSALSSECTGKWQSPAEARYAQLVRRIGVDFGGTQIKAAVVDNGQIIKSATVDTPRQAPPEAVIGAIGQAVRAVDPDPTAVGLAIPGQVDYYGMVWRLPNVPGFEAVPIAQHLMQQLDCQVVVENDATSAALGEHLWGRGRGFASYLLVTLGTGIGGGLVINDRLVRGAHGFTAEIGHIRINSSVDAWPCTCGQRGCVEAYAGTRGLLRKFAELGGHATRIREVAESARRGEPAGLEVFAHMGRWIGGLLVNVQNLLDLDAFVFTGGISQSFDLIEPSLRTTMREQAFSPPLGQVPLLVSQLGARAGLVGAAYLPMVREVAEREAESSPGELLRPAVKPDDE